MTAEIRDHADEHTDDIIAAAGSEQAALGALNGYMTAWNLRDLAGMDAAFHLPHVRIASGQIHVIKREPPCHCIQRALHKKRLSTAWSRVAAN